MLIPFVAMAVTILGLWLFLRRGHVPRPRWGAATALALVLVVLWLLFGPEDMSLTDRILTVLPVAGFVVLALSVLNFMQNITRGQGGR